MPFTKYLQTYAEADAQLAAAVEGTFDFAVAIPLLGEGTLTGELFESLSRTESGRVLAIVVVNATDAASAEMHAANEQTLARLIEGASPLPHQRPAWLRHYSETLSLLILDRARAPWRLPPRSGVGDARKIGCDVALALHAAGKVRSPILSTTDADARVAPDYFAFPARPTAALCHPFRHAVEAGESQALLLYEISLRYYVLGLRFAGSPYAFHTIGSTMSFRADAYAQVRGFPKREAAEDFYLLDKLAKLGGVSVGGGAIRLVARPSARVPFGTGRSMATIQATLERGEVYRLFDARGFEALRDWLAAASAFAEHGDTDRTRAEVAQSDHATVLLPALDRQGVWEVLATAWRTRKTAADRLRHFHTWYDGLKTLQLLHALRDAAYPKQEWKTALLNSFFLGDKPAGDDLAFLEWLRRLDETTPPPPAGATASGA